MTASEKLLALDAAMTHGRWGLSPLPEEVGVVFVETGDDQGVMIAGCNLDRHWDGLADADAIVALRNALPELAALAAAAENYSPRYDHDWRCEIRTEEAGWHEGERPVIDCCCGKAELDAALAALDAKLP